MTTTAASRRSLLGPLRVPAFRLQFTAEALAMVGSTLSPVALSLGILQLTGSTRTLGIVLASSTIASILFMLVGGVWADRLPRSRVIIGTQAAGLASRAEALGDRADSVLVGLQEFANKETAQELRETMVALQSTLRATERTMRLYGDGTRGPSAELTRTMASFRALSARLDSTLANPGLQGALGRSDSLVHSMNRMTAQLAVTTARLDTVLAGVNAGRGTIGKFATDSGLYYDLRDVSAGLKGLLTELQKNPGKIPVTVKIF